MHSLHLRSLKNFCDKIASFRSEHIFIIFAFILGMLFIIITPPAQAPDEFTHFYRAYQLTSGEIIASKRIIGEKAEVVVGGNLPRSIAVLLDAVALRGTSQHTMLLEDLITAFKIPLEKNKKEFTYGFQNTVLYSPIPYLPAIVAIKLVKNKNWSVLAIFYFVRLCNLLSWLIITYYAIKIVPILKKTFTLIALLPMTIYQSAAVSADPILFASSFLLISLILSFRFKKSHCYLSDIFLLTVVAVTVALSKNFYFPLLFLALIVPKDRFASKNKYFFFLFSTIIIPITLSLCWSFLVRNIYVPLNGSEPAKQLLFVINHPLKFIHIVFMTASAYKFDHFYSFIGKLGTFNVLLPFSYYVFALISLLLIPLIESLRFLFSSKLAPKHFLSLKEIIYFSLLFSFMFVFIYLVIYISWTPYATWPFLHGIQGRYFIPFAFLAIISFYGIIISFKFKKSTNFSNSSLTLPLFFNCFLSSYLIVFAIVSTFVSIKSMLLHFYYGNL
ncbi:MAG: DUF2142 domain-containing protein [Oligoflexia bacterium]|nr:DUF2142 domain-containing protein [Oligoflexia bacterium]